jgi:hypothetical protein
MNIAVGVNIFGRCRRQDLAITALKRQAEKFPNLKLYNITFENEQNFEPDFIHLPLLKRRARDIVRNSESEKPVSVDFFNILSGQGCEYFLFLNSDIVLTSRAIVLMMTGGFETYSFSRADCFEFHNLDAIIPFRIEIAGFDAWAVSTQWWVGNSHLFQNYIYAEPLWDVAFATTMFKNSKSKLCNKEIFIAHEKHAINWSEGSVEAKYNSDLWEKFGASENWRKFIFENLIKRQPYGQFFNPLPNEEELEISLLK